jgi:hypothetical protein
MGIPGTIKVENNTIHTPWQVAMSMYAYLIDYEENKG